MRYQKNMNTLSAFRRTSLAFAGVVTALVIGCIAIVPTVHAASVSSWNPTLLVNTESFQMIDRGDGTTDIELRFGATTQTIKFLTTNKFQFSHGISVLGTISGSSLNVDRNATIGGSLTVTGAVLSLSNITAKGILSGNSLAVSANATVSGSLLVKNNIAAKGTVSGATVTGFGLGSCNAAGQKLIYNSATQKFECGTDLDTSWSNTGSLMTGFDARYVKKAGDTMTGTLTINLTSGYMGLKVMQMLSGSIIHAEKTLTSSGTILSTGNITTRGILSGAFLRVSGPADVHGPMAVSGAIRTDGDLTINDDAGAVDAILTFGNASGNQTLKFLNTLQKFQFSKPLSVLGTISGSSLNIDRNATVGGTLSVTGAILSKSNITAKGYLSGSTLTVDGNVTLHGQTYNFPTTQTSNGFLKTDGAGNLTWSATASIGNSSGFIISLHPEYTNAIYFSSGSTFIGQLTASGGVAGVNENFYHWTSSKAAINDYWIAVRVRVPDNFSSWDPVKPIEFRYRTADGTAGNNHVTVRMKDTANAVVALSGNEGLASATFATANIGITGGTWTPKGYFTVYVKMAALTAKYAEAGFLNLNFESTMP